MVITRLDQLDPIQGIYTYADYLLWKFEERVELFKGKIFKMSAPNRKHQEILGDLYLMFRNTFKAQPSEGCCKVYIAPFDVRLPRKGNDDNQIDTVVQPDLCVICDPKKLDNRGAIGAPDLVVEIVSPGNTKKDLKYKFSLYEEAGVKEYWIIHPTDQTVSVFVLDNDKYRGLAPIVEGDTLQSVTFPNLKINTNEIFHNH